jgi:hypothetical protein
MQSPLYLQVKYQGKTPLDNKKTLNNEGQECKAGHVKERVIVGCGGR